MPYPHDPHKPTLIAAGVASFELWWQAHGQHTGADQKESLHAFLAGYGAGAITQDENPNHHRVESATVVM